MAVTVFLGMLSVSHNITDIQKEDILRISKHQLGNIYQSFSICVNKHLTCIGNQVVEFWTKDENILREDFAEVIKKWCMSCTLQLRRSKELN